MARDSGSIGALERRTRRGFPRGIVTLPMLIALPFVSAPALSVSAKPAPGEDVERLEGENI